MSREDVVAVGVRLFALFLLLLVARSFPSAIALFQQGGDQAALITIVLVMAASLAVCALLWFFPLSIARKLLPAMKEPRSESAMSGPVAFSVGLSLLGLWLLTRAIPEAFYWVTLVLLNRRNDAAYVAFDHDQLARIVLTVAELALAVWFIFGANGIRRLIERFRYGAAANLQ
ncbi:hypothetical protein [Stenotrophomonas sp. SY1]|uniref:hypothetical protein n=1 Tax=Stenotrophomonas sp. SY1 TaxID=477235 RepID=UPI001E44416B|nr:hypothetical protein [Stenotrophomonas sp. SY1]MCD9088630.1 hypothetical protein [Stenotrophomonas sp. SY1]